MICRAAVGCKRMLGEPGVSWVSSAIVSIVIEVD